MFTELGFAPNSLSALVVDDNYVCLSTTPNLRMWSPRVLEHARRGRNDATRHQSTRINTIAKNTATPVPSTYVSFAVEIAALPMRGDPLQRDSNESWRERTKQMIKCASPSDNFFRAKKLLLLRETLRLTQAEFAKSVSIALRAYQNYEWGEREMPVRLLEALATVHNVDPIWFMACDLSPPLSLSERHQLDPIYLTRVISRVDATLELHNATPAAEVKAKVIRMIYVHCLHEQHSLDQSPFVEDLLTILAKSSLSDPSL
jgi:transcriptional regulator with XRE-family HTH domain